MKITPISLKVLKPFPNWRQQLNTSLKYEGVPEFATHHNIYTLPYITLPRNIKKQLTNRGAQDFHQRASDIIQLPNGRVYSIVNAYKGCMKYFPEHLTTTLDGIYIDVGLTYEQLQKIPVHKVLAIFVLSNHQTVGIFIPNEYLTDPEVVAWRLSL